MLITILCIIGTIVLWPLFFVFINNSYRHDWCEPAGIITGTFSVIAAAGMIVTVILSSVTAARVEPALVKATYERQAIVLKLEHLDNGVLGDGQYSNGNVIDEAVAFNAKLYSSKYWHDNPWTSWFSVDLTPVGYINIEDKL